MLFHHADNLFSKLAKIWFHSEISRKLVSVFICTMIMFFGSIVTISQDTDGAHIIGTGNVDRLEILGTVSPTSEFGGDDLQAFRFEFTNSNNDLALSYVVSPNLESAKPLTEIWNLNRLEKTHSFVVDNFELGQSVSVAFSPDGQKMAEVIRGQEVTVWDLPTNEILLNTEAIARDFGTFSPSGDNFALLVSNGIAVWDVSIALQTHEIIGTFWDAQLINENTLLTSNNEGHLIKWNLSALGEASQEVLFEGYDLGSGFIAPIPSIFLTIDNNTFFFSYDRQFQLWDRQRLELIGQFNGLVLSDEDEYLIEAGDGVYFADIGTTHQLSVVPDGISVLDYHPQTSLALGVRPDFENDTSEMVIIDIQTSEILSTLVAEMPNTRLQFQARFSPDGKYIAAWDFVPSVEFPVISVWGVR